MLRPSGAESQSSFLPLVCATWSSVQEYHGFERNQRPEFLGEVLFMHVDSKLNIRNLEELSHPQGSANPSYSTHNLMKCRVPVTSKYQTSKEEFSV